MKQYFVIKNNKTNKYIDIDQTSGGYPYDTELINCKKFQLEEAIEYKNIFKNEDWKILKFQYYIEDIPLNDEDKTTSVPKLFWGVHEEHCCSYVCKYGDPECPVVLRLTKSKHNC